MYLIIYNTYIYIGSCLDLKPAHFPVLKANYWFSWTPADEDGGHGALPGTWGLVSPDKHWLRIPFFAIGMLFFTMVSCTSR